MKHKTPKSPHLRLVGPNEKPKRQQREGRKLTRATVAGRVHKIRRYIEEVASGLEGVPFDIINYDFLPPSIEIDHGEWGGPHGLAELLHPSITDNFDHVYKQVCESRICHDNGADGPLNAARFPLAATAFAIGVFAGRVFQGASKREIDKMEWGLVHAIISSPWNHCPPVLDKS